ncbi:MAG TPA: serine/threonine-protein kinase [Candidatus Nitrosotalea sp.]|nr:serine/threonine-protein kinase [Candidatus Nitrosotalea sp.]
MKATVKDAKECPNCGKPLPAGALAGLCPACLLAQGAETSPDETTQPRHFEPPSLTAIATLFPQLEILELLGAGGMGAVYKARQPALDRFVALKILPTCATPGVNMAERFNREARALARLNHPNIVAVHEFGQAGGLHFFIMEFVDGVNLRMLEQRSRLAPREALQIVPQICDALQYAHDQGVVHRDIKPENVLVDRKGRVKIADFGLARILDVDPGSLRLTAEGQVMGTPHYMAPEQVERPLAVDHRADIYSLGVVLYEMLTGDLPLGNFSPPSRKVQIDVRFDEVVLRALENDPARRYQKASEVKTQVATIAESPSQESAGVAAPAARYFGWAGFAVVSEKDGVRTVSWKGTLAALGVTFGLLSLGFAFVTVFTDRSLLGWIGIRGWPSIIARLILSIAAVAWGVRRALFSKQEPESLPRTPRGTLILPSSSRRWQIGRRLITASLMVLAWCVFEAHWLTPWLRGRFDNHPMPQVAVHDATTGALVASLPRGGKVELLAVANSETAPGESSWSPDGLRLEDARYEIRGPALVNRDSQFVSKDIVFRLIDLPRDASGPTYRFSVPSGSIRSDISVFARGQPLVGAWPWRVALPEKARELNIDVGVGLGAWRTIYTFSPADRSSQLTLQPDDPPWNPAFHQVSNNAGSAQATVMIQRPGGDWFDRVIAVDAGGVEHLDSPGTGNAEGVWVTPLAGERIWTYTFRDLPLDRVKEFRVQVQPVHWIEFRNVALKPRGQPVP